MCGRAGRYQWSEGRRSAINLGIVPIISTVDLWMPLGPTITRRLLSVIYSIPIIVLLVSVLSRAILLVRNDSSRTALPALWIAEGRSPLTSFDGEGARPSADSEVTERSNLTFLVKRVRDLSRGSKP